MGIVFCNVEFFSWELNNSFPFEKQNLALKKA